MKYYALAVLLALASCSPERPKPPVTSLVIGHGGMGISSELPTNSTESIRALCELSHTEEHFIDGMELDVQLTKDGQLVLFQDAFIDNNGQKLPIRALNFAEVRKKDATGRTVIPTLESALKNTLCQNMLIFLDIKLHKHEEDDTAYEGEFANALVKLLTTLHVRSRMIIESRSPSFLNAIAARSEEFKCFYHAPDQALLETLIVNRREQLTKHDGDWESIISGLSVNSDHINADQVAAAQSLGLEVAVFGCEDSEGNFACAMLEPDYIQSDEVELLGKWKAQTPSMSK